MQSKKVKRDFSENIFNSVEEEDEIFKAKIVEPEKKIDAKIAIN